MFTDLSMGTRAPRRALRLALCLGLLSGFAGPAAAKTTRFWNLTANTITSFELAPSGTGKYGTDFAKSDPDGSVDHDERLKIPAVASGSYDAKLIDSKGRSCIVKGLAVKEGSVFSIEESQLKDCTGGK